MDFIKNWWGGTNNASGDICASNAKNKNQVKKRKISPIHAFYRELFDAAKDGPNVSKDLKKFRSKCTININAIIDAKRKKDKTEIKKNRDLVDKSVEALIDESMKCGAKENVIKVIKKYNGKLSEALNRKIDKILNENGLSNRSNSTAKSTENVSEKLIASDKKPAPAAFKRKKAEDSFSKPKVDNKKPAPAVYKRNAAGSFSTSKKNAHNNENVDNSVVSKNENLNVVAEEENKVNEVDAKAKEICKESTSLFKKCVSAGGNLLWWGVKAPFKGVEYSLYYLYKAACYSYKYASVGLEKLEAAEKFLNRPIVKKAVYYALDSLIEKNIKSDIAIAGEKAATDTIKDLIRKGHQNIDLIAGAVGGSIGGPIGVGVGFVLSRFASNFLSRSEKAVDSMDKRWHNAILKKYCADQKTFIGEKALTLFCVLNSIGYFDDLKIGEDKSVGNNSEKK